MKKTLVRLLLVVVLGFSWSGAYACGGIFDVLCNLSHGGLSPGRLSLSNGLNPSNIVKQRNGELTRCASTCTPKTFHLWKLVHMDLSFFSPSRPR